MNGSTLVQLLRQQPSALGRLFTFASTLMIVPIPSLAAPPQELSAPVTVKNDETSPVPVTLQSGASIGVDGDVSVGGTVEVEPGQDPLLVDQAGESVSFLTIGAQVCPRADNGGINECNGDVSADIYDVPEGRTLIIDAVTIGFTCDNCIASVPRQYAVLNPGQKGSAYLIGELQTTNIFSFETTHVGRASASGLGLRVAGGRIVSADCTAVGTIYSTSRKCSLRVWGRLIDE
jgi:hypothetical protein